MAAAARITKRREAFRASSAVTTLAITASLLLAVLLRCSEAFVGLPSRAGSPTRSSNGIITSAGGVRARAQAPRSSIDARRERMATLSQVHWGLPGVGVCSGGVCSGGDSRQGGQRVGRATGDLGSATALTSSSGGGVRDRGEARGWRMVAEGQGFRKGPLGTARRLVARALRRGGGGQVCSPRRRFLFIFVLIKTYDRMSDVFLRIVCRCVCMSCH